MAAEQRATPVEQLVKPRVNHEQQDIELAEQALKHY
jgi:hypothetical protein